MGNKTHVTLLYKCRHIVLVNDVILNNRYSSLGDTFYSRIFRSVSRSSYFCKKTKKYKLGESRREKGKQHKTRFRVTSPPARKETRLRESVIRPSDAQRLLPTTAQSFFLAREGGDAQSDTHTQR